MKFISKITSLEVWVKQPQKTIVDGEVVIKPGRKIQFIGGVYETDDKAEIEAIKKYAGNVVIEVGKDTPQSPDEIKTKEELEAEEREQQKQTEEDEVKSQAETSDLEKMTLQQLRQTAKSLGITYGPKTKKAELVELISKAEESGETPQF